MQVFGLPNVQCLRLRPQQPIVEGRVANVPVVHHPAQPVRAEGRTTRVLTAEDLTDQPVRGSQVLSRHLNRQDSAGAQVTEQARQELLVIRNPVQRRVAEHEVDRLLGLPSSQVLQLPAQSRKGRTSPVDHLLGVIHTQHIGPRKPVRQARQQLAGPAPEVNCFWVGLLGNPS